MPVELRKRKAPAAPAPPPPAKKQTKAAPKAKAADKLKAAEPAAAANGAGAAKHSGKVAEGDVITLEGFGGEIKTNDGTETTLKALVDESKAGVVLFTYPKASTPGCTKQACMFRDSYEPLTAGGLAIYGLSKDSPTSNTTFKEKQKLPYPLLCDPEARLIGAIGMKKAPASTTRGVFVVDKSGKVLACTPGSPGDTVEVVKKLVASMADGDDAAAPAGDDAEEHKENGPTADEEKKDEEKRNGNAKEEEKADDEKKDE